MASLAQWHLEPMSFTIRAATRADVQAMYRIRTSVRENRLSDPARITEASSLPYVDAGTAWVADAGPALLGFAAADRATMSVWALFVAPEAEGAGVGRALHRTLILWARNQNLPLLRLSTESGTRAERFYQKAGWTRVGTTADGETQFEIDPSV